LVIVVILLSRFPAETEGNNGGINLGAVITVDHREIWSPDEPKAVDAVDMDESVR
jgi:hypothetical protein